MNNRKIKLLFDGGILPYFLYKNKNRSGILFSVANLLNEFAKRDDLEITICYEYQMYDEMLELKKLGIIPESCSLMDIKDLAFPVISSFINVLFKLRRKYPKDAPDDNIYKKFIRFVAARYFRFYYKYALYLSNFRNVAKNYDVFFSPCNNIHKMIFSIPNLKPYLLIYDVIPLKLKEFYKGFEDQIAGMERIVQSINYKDIYFTISENTKNDIIEYKKGINPSHFVVTYLGANSSFYRETDDNVIKNVRLKYGIPENKKYIFSLCTLEPRKNLVFAIKNFLEFVNKNNVNGFVFVLGGAAWKNFPAVLEQELQGFESAKNYIKTIGYVDDRDVPVLYSGAEMFVYPTLYEGFGLPILEAMQCGCPVITSDTSSIPEVIGDAGIMINPHSDEELVQAIEKMYFDNDYRHSCITKGLERAKLFSWEKTANIIVEQFKKDLNNETVI